MHYLVRFHRATRGKTCSFFTSLDSYLFLSLLLKLPLKYIREKLLVRCAFKQEGLTGINTGMCVYVHKMFHIITLFIWRIFQGLRGAHIISNHSTTSLRVQLIFWSGDRLKHISNNLLAF